MVSHTRWSPLSGANSHRANRGICFVTAPKTRPLARRVQWCMETPFPRLRNGPGAVARRSPRRARDGRQARAFFRSQRFSFAPPGVSFIIMRTSKPNTDRISASELRQLEARAFAGRSDVYRYLHKNHSRLVGQKVATDNGPSWNEVAAILSKRGYVSCRGDPLNGHAVRRVFRRVEKDLAREETARQPSRAPPRRDSLTGNRRSWTPPKPRRPRAGAMRRQIFRWHEPSRRPTRRRWG